MDHDAWTMGNAASRPGVVKPNPSSGLGADLAIVVPCLNESRNLKILLPRLAAVVREMIVSTEIVVVDGGSSDGTTATAARLGARVIHSRFRGYGGAVRAAFAEVKSPCIITLDADFSHHPSIIPHLYAMRNQADIIIASRYIQGGYSRAPWLRQILSRVLNSVFRSVLSLPVHDMSSGFRLYHREAIAALDLRHTTYAILQEILTKAYCAGHQIMEIPFHYLPRRYGKSHVKLFRFGLDYLAVMWEMWRVRNSIMSADYDTRAFHSRVPFQRYWQRKRYDIITGYIADRMRVLDAGCGSTQILNGAPQCIGLDIRHAKLRFMRRPGRRLINASIFALPFQNEKFEVVVCSQVIEHVPDDDSIFRELVRVIEPGGSLILGTPDYGSLSWPIIEKLYAIAQPGGYADEHITHYTRHSLIKRLRAHGLEVLDHTYICGGELIIHARKPGN